MNAIAAALSNDNGDSVLRHLWRKTHAWRSPLRRYRDGRHVLYGKAIN